MSKELPNELKVLQAVLQCQMAVFAMDGIEGLPVYSRDVKYTGKKFLKEIEKYTTAMMPLVFGVQDSTLYALMDSINELLQGVVSIKPEDVRVLNVMLETYRERPDEVLSFLDVEMIDK